MTGFLKSAGRSSAVLRVSLQKAACLLNLRKKFKQVSDVIPIAPAASKLTTYFKNEIVRLEVWSVHTVSAVGFHSLSSGFRMSS